MAGVKWWRAPCLLGATVERRRGWRLKSWLKRWLEQWLERWLGPWLQRWL